MTFMLLVMFSVLVYYIGLYKLRSECDFQLVLLMVLTIVAHRYFNVLTVIYHYRNGVLSLLKSILAMMLEQSIQNS